MVNKCMFDMFRVDYLNIHKSYQQTKNQKTSGPDEITGEVLKLLGMVRISVIHDICKKIWMTCEWPKESTSSVIVSLLKKDQPEKAHRSKLLLYIIKERLNHFLDSHNPKYEGSVKGRGTREQITNVRQLIEKCR